MTSRKGKSPYFRVFSVLFWCGTLLLTAMSHSLAQAPADPIAAGFKNVPPEARLRMFWRIFGPAWTREEIEYQFDQLQQAGVGGVMTCFTYPVALDDPAHGIQNQRFLAPTFLETLRYAAERARKQNLEFGVCGGTGWPFGGPTVSLHDAAQRLRAEALHPLPDDSGYALPKLRDGEHCLAVFCGKRDVTAALHGDRLEVPPSPAEPCQAFIAGPTYMAVKRPALGGEGYVLDHFSRAATQRYLNTVVAPLLAAAPDGRIRSLFCDSLEVYNANWTHDFPAQFKRRRGYDPIPHLPELFDDRSPAAPDLRFDWWRTAAELAEEEFARTVHAWCRGHQVAFALEPYGTPSLSLASARYCDVPWGEQYEWKGFSFSRFAASAGHLAGKKVIGAEAWTWIGLPNRLADSLSDLKLCSDLHFLAGENELTGVDFPYSPRSAGVPGWTPYYGPVLNQNNPQWPFFSYLAGYVNRCQWLLRQGRPVADVALYVPAEDAFANGATDQMLLDFQLRDRLASGVLTDEFGLQKAFRHHSDVVYTLLTNGYNFDGIDFSAMNALTRVQGKTLAAGDGRYSILLLPNLAGMDPAALEKAARFCRAGGTIIATRRLPDRVYGFGQEKATQRLRALIRELFGPEAVARTTSTRADKEAPSLSVHSYGKGKAIFAPDEREALEDALAQAAVGPDVRLSPFQPEVSHVHRHAGDRDFYFLANVGESEASFLADFRVAGRAAFRWDPMDGSIAPMPVHAQTPGRTQIALTLPPRGSLFLCFAAGTPHLQLTEGPRVSMTAHPLEIAWHVTFDGPDAPPPYESPMLNSWTQWPGARFFSGRAIYTGTFTQPSVVPDRAILRFHEVHEAAEVQVNGHLAGAVWMPPYELDVARYLRSGENTLRITVANLPVNRVLGLPDPDLQLLRAVFGNRFPAPEEKRLLAEPLPSGLIGNLTLQTASQKGNE